MNLLLVKKGERPQAAPTFPELCCHTVRDLEIINDREKISFLNTPEQREWHAREIIPYWEKRSIRYCILSEMTEEWYIAYNAGIFTEFMEQRGPGHLLVAQIKYIIWVLVIIKRHSEGDRRA